MNIPCWNALTFNGLHRIEIEWWIFLDLMSPTLIKLQYHGVDSHHGNPTSSKMHKKLG